MFIIAQQYHKKYFCRYMELSIINFFLLHYHRSSAQCRLPGHRSRSSSLSLTVESALESFDFLNTSDFDDEDTGDDNTTPVLSIPQRSPVFDTDGERIG